MKKSILAIFLALILICLNLTGCGKQSSVNLSGIKQSKTLTAVTSKYDDGLEIGVISYDVVKDFKADNTGKEDATDAINDALFQAQMDGGGTVYLPQGKYLVTDLIDVPKNVVLRGEWQSPSKEAVGDNGTYLIADNDEIFKTDPVIFINESGGIQNLTIIYPNQSVAEPVEYYYAVEIGYYRCFTLENITILGAWDGIDIGNLIRGNEIYYLNNVYISALHLGIYNNWTTDTGRMEHVFISPEYWMKNNLYPMDKKAKNDTRDYFRANSRGIEFYKNDWSVSYDMYFADLNIGLYFGITDRAFDGKFMNVEIKNCDIGIYFDRTKLGGPGFTNLKITTDWESAAAIDSGDEQDGSCIFYNTEISGPFKTPIRNNGLGQTSTSSSYNFVSGKISGYDFSNTYAVTLNGGSVTMQEFEFGEEKHHVRVSDKIQSLQLLGCTFAGTEDFSIPAASKANCDIDNTPVENHDLQNTEHIYPKKIPSVKSTVIVDVRDYGAATDKTDNTKAVQEALNALRGVGGIVYIPAGNWRFEGELVVPTGVELRGSTPVQQMQSSECTSGTILWIYSGKGDEAGTPFIILEEESGMRGLCTYYPDQNIDGEIEYPWTIRAVGKNCWVEDICITNSYNGIDFGTYKTDGFYINWVGGSPGRRGIFVGNANEGWLQNCQLNPNYAYIYGHNSTNTDYRLYYCDVFIIGAVDNLHAFNVFEYGSKTGMLFIEQDGKSANGAIIHLGVDGSETSVRIWKAGEIEFVGSQLVAMKSINQKTNILVEETFEGKAAFVNSRVWGPSNTYIKVEGGTVDINLLNICGGFGDYSLHTTGGKLNMTCAIFHNSKTLIEKGTEQISLYGCYVRGYQSKLALNDQSKADVKNDHAWWS